MENFNPFLVSGYRSPAYFCDRKRETQQLKEALLNGRNIVLFSPRRLGKTGLIRHLFYKLRKEDIHTVYIDIFGTENFNQFLQQFANAIVQNLISPKESFMDRVLKIFSQIRPQFSMNEGSGMPGMSFALQTDMEKLVTFKEAIQFMEKQNRKIFVAIDEFQQITQYPETNVEEILRSHIQHLRNVSFIFSGSQKHLLLPMFSDAKRAFYQSSDFLSMVKIDHHEYKDFILKHFEEGQQRIHEDTVDFILEWTKHYTFYTQYVCNKLFAKRHKQINPAEVNEVIREIFAEREIVYYNYRKLISSHQFDLLKAIAAEGTVTEPTSADFIRKYALSAHATVRKNLSALLDKELIYETLSGQKPVYEVYDVFLSRWLANMLFNKG